MMSNSRIMELTEEQRALLPVWRDKWTAVGLSCEPLDFERAKDAASRAYRAAGLEPPTQFIVCDSPLSGAITAANLTTRASVLASVRGSVWASVWESVGASVWESVGASVWESVSDSVRESVWESVRGSVWASVSDSVWESVRGSVWASVSDSVRESVSDSILASASVSDSVRESVYGAHDAHWLGYYDFFLTVLNMPQVEPLRPLIDLAHHCGWWIPYRDVCILQHRHSSLHRDELGRLHNPDGMAVAYPDGWGVWAWHGLRVPERIITAVPTAEMVMQEDNAEYKRVLIERLGADRFINDINAETISTDDFGRLLRADIGDREPYQVVEVVNGTPNPDGSPKTYWLPVPFRNELRNDEVIVTAHEAVAWSYGLLPEQYAPIIRT